VAAIIIALNGKLIADQFGAHFLNG
jgi:hypothetical protein